MTSVLNSLFHKDLTLALFNGSHNIFNKDIYRDVNDIFGKNNSQRQFYTVPGKTNPNDLEVINPSNEESCAVISLGDKDDVDKAVSAARTAYQSWSITPKEERLSID